MPSSAYRCTQCQQIFEQWHKDNDIQRKVMCPVCSGKCTIVTNESLYIMRRAHKTATRFKNKKNIIFRELGQLSPSIVY